MQNNDKLKNYNDELRIMKFKLVIFDMDGTLLNGRTIYEFAEKIGFKNELNYLINSDKKFYEITIEIAKLLKGIEKITLLEIFRKIPLQNNVEKVIKILKEKNIKTAIVTDSYQFVANDLRNKLGIDYVYANKLILKNGLFTGEIILHNNKLIRDCILDDIYSICKSCVLKELCKTLNISNNEVLAIGDGIVDISMLNKAGLGIAYKASGKVKKYADIASNDLISILDYI
jgi:phosphoserine phosphatase